MDEFALQMLREYDGKTFTNICADQLDLDTEDEKKALEGENEASKDLLSFMKESLGDAVNEVRFTNNLKNYAVCLTSEGALSLEMEKALNQMPNASGMKAQLVLEINIAHPVAEKLKTLFVTDQEKLKDYAKLLYAQGCLISGKSIDDPAELSKLICDLM